jgi:hypothetical protein
VQRPANAFDAFRRAAEEGASSVWSAVSGVIMDPTQVCFPLLVAVQHCGKSSTSDIRRPLHRASTAAACRWPRWAWPRACWGWGCAPRWACWR